MKPIMVAFWNEDPIQLVPYTSEIAKDQDPWDAFKEELKWNPEDWDDEEPYACGYRYCIISPDEEDKLKRLQENLPEPRTNGELEDIWEILVTAFKAAARCTIGDTEMAETIHELVNRKMQEAGIKVTDRPVYVVPDCLGPRCGQSFIPGAEVTVGEFTVIGLAYLSESLAQQVAMHTPGEKDPQTWLPHCTIGVAEPAECMDDVEEVEVDDI